MEELFNKTENLIHLYLEIANTKFRYTWNTIDDATRTKYNIKRKKAEETLEEVYNPTNKIITAAGGKRRKTRSRKSRKTKKRRTRKSRKSRRSRR